MRISKIHNKYLSTIGKVLILLVLVTAFSFVNNLEVSAEANVNITSSDDSSDNDSSLFGINITGNDGEGISGALHIVLLLTVIALCPSILIMLTSFTRILIVLHFTRSALNTQTAPHNRE